jgi:hypothetical protein
MVTLEVLEPRGVLSNPKREGLSNPRVSDLNGKRIAILGHSKSLFFEAIEVMLKEAYPTAEIVRFMSLSMPNAPDTSAEIAEACDVWIEGVRDAGTGSRHDAGALMERRGRPGVSICSDVLLPIKKLQSDFNGMPTLRVVTVPATDYLVAKRDPERMNAVAAAAYDDIVKALTAPLTKEEQEVSDADYDYSPKTFTGADYAEAYEKWQQYCTERFLTDGLPVTPPTREAVDRMLAGTSYPPDKAIGLMFPQLGIATVEKIAISAVMAGAKPEYLPVILAMIEAITSKDFNQYHIVNEVLPITLISGPIIEELGINNKIGYVAPGHRPNATIGRSLLMCMINIGWRYMHIYSSPGGIGQPAAYANYVIPENQTENPWESFAEEQGFGSEESIVIVCEATQITRGPSETLSNADFEERLENMGDMLSVNSEMFNFFGMPEDGSNARFMIAMHPTFARQLANAGFTKQAFVQWLYDRNVIDWNTMSEEAREWFLKDVVKGRTFDSRFFGYTVADCKPGLHREPFSDPKHVAVIVAGTGAGGVIMFATGSGSTAHVEDVETPRPFMHKVIHGATLTKYGR